MTQRVPKYVSFHKLKSVSNSRLSNKRTLLSETRLAVDLWVGLALYNSYYTFKVVPFPLVF